MPGERWLFCVDRGGTFSDCIAYPPRVDRGRDKVSGPRVLKLLSDDLAPVRAVREILALGPESEVPPLELRLGTTLCTNALLERRGCPVAVVLSAGFEDLFEIDDQTRP